MGVATLPIHHQDRRSYLEATQVAQFLRRLLLALRPTIRYPSLITEVSPTKVAVIPARG